MWVGWAVASETPGLTPPSVFLNHMTTYPSPTVILKDPWKEGHVSTVHMGAPCGAYKDQVWLAPGLILSPVA